MASRPEGIALLVGGHGVVDGGALHTLGQIGEALLATGAAWQIRRLAVTAGARYAPDRGTLKRHLDELSAEPVRAAVLVMLGSIVELPLEESREIGEGCAPAALVTGAQPERYPEDATLPLGWIGDRLRDAQAEQLVAVVSAQGGAPPPSAWLRALCTRRSSRLIAVAATQREDHPVLGTLLAALCGEALDPRTGTVTMASLSRHLAADPQTLVAPSDSAETLAQPPPLAGLWDVRRSQLSVLGRVGRPRSFGGSADDLCGTVLPGRFRIDVEVKRGTFGTVYRARQLAVERDVAVKVLHADIDPASEDGRLFVQEIRSVGRLDHANVVRIHQADITHDGRLFFAMELLDGRDLQEVGAAGPLPRARAIELVRQLLAGLGAAHDAGLVHADVKPANAIVVARGEAERVVLVDFGLARLRAPDRPTESAGGTPAYMAPEQLQLARVDARSDLFSAALVLVYLLTGWVRPDEHTLTPPLELIEDPELRGVIARALELDPARRYASARELALALTGVVPAAATPRASVPAPFRQLAPLTEDDRGRLHGREADLASLTQLALYRRSVIYTAPSGTGKTSILRAGLVPRLEALGVRAVYLRCRADSSAALASAIASVAGMASRRSSPVIGRRRDSTPVPVGGAAAEVAPRLARPEGAARPDGAGGEGEAPDGADVADAFGETQPRRALAPAVAAPAQTRATAVTALSSSSSSSSPSSSSPSSSSAVAPGAVAEAIASWHRQRGGKLVLILDQVEAALGDEGFVAEALGFADWPPDADVSVVLSIREDHLARLLARAQDLEPGIPLVRLPPLGLDGARVAITGPLTEARLSIDPDLLDALLGDLQRAAAAIGPEMGWGTAPAVFPPHLQLACSVLYEELAPDDAVLTLAHYRRLGGFDAIVGEHLERVLDTELTSGRDQIARALFVALVTASHERAMRPEAELIAMVGDAERVGEVLEVLRSRGLVVRVRGDDGAPSWELAHDSLVPRVRAWLDARDLARRQAVELVRYHLRRSRADAPSLLSRRELRELAGHEGAIAELDAEWSRRMTDEPWTPSRLVARSRRVARWSLAAICALVGAVLAVVGGAIYREQVEATRRRLDIGRFVLTLAPFDWDPVGLRAIAVDAARVPLRWELRRWRPEDEPGPRFADEEVVRGEPMIEAGVAVEHVEAHGGRAFLVVERGACAPSVVPLLDLPGYADRDRPEPVLRVAVPTCDASRVDTVPVPAGAFLYGGPGEPASHVVANDPDPAVRAERRVELPAFRIDRTEVTNAAFGVFAAMAAFTDIAPPRYPGGRELLHAGEPRKPVTGINWRVANAYCRFLGKQLPSSEEWVKAMRGGERLPDGTANPSPRRNLPWGGDGQSAAARAQLDSALGVADVATHPGDVSVYGVLDLAGNALEWTRTRSSEGIRYVRGGGTLREVGDAIVDYMAIANPRTEVASGMFEVGLRCAVADGP